MINEITIFSCTIINAMKNRRLLNSSIIIAIYVVLCLVLEPFSFGVIQFRISEILCLLAIEYPYAIFANTIACFISNMALGGLGMIDTIVGSFATFLGCTVAHLLRKKKYRCLPILSGLAIVLINGLIVGIELGLVTSNAHMIPITIIEITISEFIVIMLIGLPLYNKLINVIKNEQK